MGYLITEASDRDLATISVFFEPALAETGLDVVAPYDGASAYSTLSQMEKTDEAVIFVVKKGGEVVGFLGGIMSEPYWNIHVPVALHMFWWVHPEHRKKGLGQKLLGTFEAWARDKGAVSVSFSVPVNGAAQKALRDYQRSEIKMYRRL